MLVIRLQRTGRKNTPAYRIVVAEKARPVKGKFQEILGHYLPSRATPVFAVHRERVTYWVGKGARPSNTVARLLKRDGMHDMDRFIVPYTKQRSKSAPPEAPSNQAPNAAGGSDMPESTSIAKDAQAGGDDKQPAAA